MTNSGIKIYFIVILLFIGFSKAIFAQLAPVPEGRRLRDIVKDNFPDGNLMIGATTGEWAFNTATGEIMDREFNYVTPENDFKQHVIHPDNTTRWYWSKPDRWIGHVAYNKQILRMHGPIGPQCSNWADGDTRTAEELEKNMRDFFTASCKRYNGTPNFEYMDVVNEVVINGAWHKNKPGTDWENPWFIIGQDTDKNKTPLYIKYAFEMAKEHAPDVKFIFNHHEGTLNSSSWNLIKETIAYLRNQDLRVDGIGWQAHVDAGWEKVAGQPEALRNLIDWAHQNDLEFHVTEQSVYINSTNDYDYQKQADTYKAIIDILMEKSANGKVGWNTWHIDDGHGWNIDRFPSIFDKNYRAKPAYYAIQFALETKGDYTTPHNVTINVKNTESAEFVENAKVVFNNETKYTNENGQVIFSAPASQYSVLAERQYMYSTELANLGVFSDTTFTVSLDSSIVTYNVTFQLEDVISGNNIASANISIDTLNQQTDYNGTTTYTIEPGIYNIDFSKEDYKNYTSDFQVFSDTTFFIQLGKSHADVKFRIKSGTQPVKNALVILNNDSLYTTSLGICTFNSLPVDSSFTYFVEIENYESTGGSFTLNAIDTILNLFLLKTIANIEFQITTTEGIIRNPYVVFNNDTVWLNAEGKGIFYNYSINNYYSFKILSDNFPEYKNTIFLEKDTTLTVQLSLTGISELPENRRVLLYPNPTKNKLHLNNVLEYKTIEIINLSGIVVYRAINTMKYLEIDVSEFPGGSYFVKLAGEKKNTSIVQPFIKQ